MKRTILCVLLCVFVLCGCSAEPSSKYEYEQDEAYNVGYDNGYEDGIKYALVLNKANQNSKHMQFHPFFIKEFNEVLGSLCKTIVKV